jgi:ribosomal protein S12 methylthiotransferase accessory factor
MAVRPNSKTLAVSQGKGLNSPAAQASAIMEAAEFAIAEQFSIPTRRCSLTDLAADGMNAVALNNLIARGQPLVGEGDVLAWIEGFDLLKHQSVWVPADAISLDAVERPGSKRFWQSSDGLASGNILLEAVVHGLCERIERDATALWLFLPDEEVFERCVDPVSLADAAVDGLAAQIKRTNFQLRLFDITSDIGVPVYFAVIAPQADGCEKHWKHFDLSSGIGCHPSAARAAIRAITEAAQSRITSITGARDDFDPNLYRTDLKADLAGYLKALPRARLVEKRGPSDPVDNLEFLLGQLRNAGIGSVIVVPLAGDEHGFAVAKVIVAELENPPGDRRLRFGRRALKAMTAIQ